jgi:hypothetical protein
MEVDMLFQDYKRLVFETALHAENFWINLAKKDYLITEVLNIGDLIVDNYLQVKDLYERIISRKPDYKEAV